MVDLSSVGRVAVYVDGADEVDPELRLIKGGGGALTREKICACAAERSCASPTRANSSTISARSPADRGHPDGGRHVCEVRHRVGGTASEREGFATDNGNPILDVLGARLDRSPTALEGAIDAIPGVVSSGIFARRRADIALVAGELVYGTAGLQVPAVALHRSSAA